MITRLVLVLEFFNADNVLETVRDARGARRLGTRRYINIARDKIF